MTIRKQNRRQDVLIALSLVFFTLSTHAQTDYRYAVFEVSIGDGMGSYAWALNELGQVGGAIDAPIGFTPAIWLQPDQPAVDLGTFGGNYGEVRALNNQGQAAGWATYEGAGAFDRRAFFWDGDEMNDLGTFGGKWGQAYAINEASQVVGHTRSPDDRAWAFIWEEGKMIHLEGLHPERNHEARGMNNAGLVVGYAWDTSQYGQKHAVVWEDGKIRDLGALGGDERRSTAWDVNESGYVVGGSDVSPAYTNAFVWFDGQMYDLGRLPTKTAAFALNINNHNQIVGFATRGFPNDDAFIWQQGEGMRRLDELTAPRANWRFHAAWGLNDAGQICGNGYRLSDRSTKIGFFLTPVNPTMDLSAPVPGNAGESNTLTITNVTPGQRVFFYYSRNGGGARIPDCDLQQNALQLHEPKLIGSAIANQNGIATITKTVPTAARNQWILMQAVVPGECAISQLVVHRFE